MLTLLILEMLIKRLYHRLCARLSALIMQSRCLQENKLKAAAHRVKLVLLKLNQLLFTLTQFIFALTMEARHY